MSYILYNRVLVLIYTSVTNQRQDNSIPCAIFLQYNVMLTSNRTAKLFRNNPHRQRKITTKHSLSYPYKSTHHEYTMYIFKFRDYCPRDSEPFIRIRRLLKVRAGLRLMFFRLSHCKSAMLSCNPSFRTRCQGNSCMGISPMLFGRIT